MSAYYDITHGIGLGIVTPRWMEYVLSEETAPKFARFGREVFGVAGKDDLESAKLAIQAYRNFCQSLGTPSSLAELGIEADHLDEMAEYAVKAEGLTYAWVPLSAEDVKVIYEKCLA